MGESTAGSRRELAGQPDLTYAAFNGSQVANSRISRTPQRKTDTQESGIGPDACTLLLQFCNTA